MFDIRIHFAFLAVTCALSLSMLGCGSGRQQTSQGQQTAVVYDKEKVVCKREHSTGSNIPVMRCYRRAEANQRRANDQAQIEALQQRSAVEPNP
jgi:hypothetical protein